ncbi:MAG: cysteinyl-tRNA synthetase [Parcubacteria group bacterium Gr01-1014_56]|nr:MAG: cysteinyl-tRNA synthetase [Parcubacteria group bacterium Gr01-1014_56]
MGLFSFLKKEPKKIPLRFHNTLSGKLEEFSPLGKRVVTMYNCGPTPYDRQHIGNMVPPVLADTLRRVLEVWGYKVKQVMNITDFGHLTGDNEGDPNEGDDKMTRGLAREGLKPTMANMRKLAEKYAGLFFEDITLLGVNTNRVTYPRASDYIPEQIALIETLEQKGYAYTIKDGVYYDALKFKGYGKLGNINLEGQREGVRVEEKKDKKNPHDFVLWKLSERMGWPSPWGKGFPGWHIECTAMIFKLLGKQIDIHTGGIEHIPIHHNNEIAQAEAAVGKQFVKYWLHNAHITVEGKKISKSLGNTVYLHNIIDKGFSPRAFRYWFLTGHYRTPMNFTWEAIEGANTALRRLTRTYLELPEGGKPHEEFLNNFYLALSEDLNTASALGQTWDFIKGSTGYEKVSPADKKATLIKVDNILGLGFSLPREAARLKVLAQSDLPPEVARLLDEREEARKNKDFTKADDLRKQIEAHGFELKDTPLGTQLLKK